MKKILTFVFKHPLGDCSNNGLTSKYSHLNLYHGELNEEEVNELPEDSLILIERVLLGKQANYAVPVEFYKTKRHSMAGGNWVYTSDSRFPSDSPISVHDRVEF